jgi:hypothetical protein
MRNHALTRLGAATRAAQAATTAAQTAASAAQTAAAATGVGASPAGRWRTLVDRINRWSGRTCTRPDCDQEQCRRGR